MLVGTLTRGLGEVSVINTATASLLEGGERG